MLFSIMKRSSTFSWSEIAKEMKTRNAKQCRQRWTEHLRDDITNLEFTSEEDNLLYRNYIFHNGAWAKMLDHFPGRTSQQLRNRFNRIHRDENDVSRFRSFILMENEVEKNFNAYLDICCELVERKEEMTTKTSGPRINFKLCPVGSVTKCTTKTSFKNVFKKEIFSHRLSYTTKNVEM